MNAGITALGPCVTRLTMVCALAFAPMAVSAQCPDGTPPPCRRAAPAAGVRVANPTLDDHAWIVVPFANATRTPDLDWLRDATRRAADQEVARRVGGLIIARRPLPRVHRSASQALTAAASGRTAAILELDNVHAVVDAVCFVGVVSMRT